MKHCIEYNGHIHEFSDDEETIEKIQHNISFAKNYAKNLSERQNGEKPIGKMKHRIEYNGDIYEFSDDEETIKKIQQDATFAEEYTQKLIDNRNKGKLLVLANAAEAVLTFDTNDEMQQDNKLFVEESAWDVMQHEAGNFNNENPFDVASAAQGVLTMDSNYEMQNENKFFVEESAGMIIQQSNDLNPLDISGAAEGELIIDSNYIIQNEIPDLSFEMESSQTFTEPTNKEKTLDVASTAKAEFRIDSIEYTQKEKAFWTHDDVLIFLEECLKLKKELHNSSCRRRSVFQTILLAMQKKDKHFTIEALENKLKNLKRKYKNLLTIKKKKPSTQPKVPWPYMRQMYELCSEELNAKLIPLLNTLSAGHKATPLPSTSKNHTPRGNSQMPPPEPMESSGYSAFEFAQRHVYNVHPTPCSITCQAALQLEERRTVAYEMIARELQRYNDLKQQKIDLTKMNPCFSNLNHF